MQQSKSIKNLSELDWVSKKDDRLGISLVRLLKNFNLNAVGKLLKDSKTKGICPKDIFMTLFMFPFFGIKNIRCWIYSGLSADVKGKKDAYYNLINNPNIKWRDIVTHFAKGFVKTVEKRTEEKPDEKDNVKYSPMCMILDDTTVEKTGKKIEYVGRVCDHNTQKPRYPLGFKILTLGFWDGKSSLPLDFSIHQEPGKEKNRGLKTKELRVQYKKKRDRQCASMERVAELTMTKIESGINMIARAIKKGLIPRYILADSWFISEGFIESIIGLVTNRKERIDVIGLMKSNRTVEFNGKQRKVELMPKLYHSRIQTSRKMKCRYLHLHVSYKGIPLNVFFVMMNGQESWKLLITTDDKLTFIKAMEYYQIRWTIEVFFRDAKQNLNFGKCQSRDFDALIATTSLALMHYIVLTLGKRFDDYETFGEVFRAFKDKLLEQTLMQRIWAMLKDIYLKVLIAIGMEWDFFVRQVIAGVDFKKTFAACAQIFGGDGPQTESKLSLL